MPWIRCNDGQIWCPFHSVNLTNVDTIGVYLIWRTARGLVDPPRAVRVGQGDIAERIRAHRNDEEITRHGTRETLKVTWMELAGLDARLAAERYLADHYRPLVGDYPNVRPMPVALPW